MLLIAVIVFCHMMLVFVLLVSVVVFVVFIYSLYIPISIKDLFIRNHASSAPLELLPLSPCNSAMLRGSRYY